MMPSTMRDEDVLEVASDRLDRWIEGQAFAGWDPHDLLNSPFLKPLLWKPGLTHLPAILVVQAGRRSSCNPRRLLRVPKVRGGKALGLFLQSYSRKAALHGRSTHQETVANLLKWLLQTAARGQGWMGWGHPFPWPNRAFFAERNEPTAVNTSFVIQGLLDCYVLLDEPLAISMADQGGEFLVGKLRRQEHADEVAFSYTATDGRHVHNANVLTGAALARLGRLRERPEWLDLARAAARFTVRRQHDDGSWPYGEGAFDRWTDSFHTGFVLDALLEIDRWAGEVSIRQAVERGHAFWLTHMFRADGFPRYELRHTYPLDAHCAAQAVLTNCRYPAPYGLARARSAASWAVRELQQPEGWFAYQARPTGLTRIPYMRWSQAWMQRALTELMWREAGRSDV